MVRRSFPWVLAISGPDGLDQTFSETWVSEFDQIASNDPDEATTAMRMDVPHMLLQLRPARYRSVPVVRLIAEPSVGDLRRLIETKAGTCMIKWDFPVRRKHCPFGRKRGDRVIA
jgi:hypothetical protein